MTQSPNQELVQFKDVPVGAKLYDRQKTVLMVKVNETQAVSATDEQKRRITIPGSDPVWRVYG